MASVHTPKSVKPALLAVQLAAPSVDLSTPAPSIPAA
jgi:hypothetical protein